MSSFVVAVVDRAAGWAVEVLGPFVSRDEAREEQVRARARLRELPAGRGSVGRSGADDYDVRVVERP